MSEGAISTETELEKGEGILRAAKKKKQAKRNTLAGENAERALETIENGVEQLEEQREVLKWLAEDEAAPLRLS